MKMTTVDLRTEAAAEASRLTTLRAIDRPHRSQPTSDLDAGGPSVARARNARTRQALAGRTLLVWRIGCEDPSGRTSANALVGMLVNLTPSPSGRDSRSRTRNFVNGIESCVPDTIERGFRAGQQAIGEMSSARARARLAREQAIARDISAIGGATPAYQAGLFDRRSERVHEVRTAAAEQIEHCVERRVASASAAATLSPSTPRLLLVLTP
jgi:hypothetical protein